MDFKTFYRRFGARPGEGVKRPSKLVEQENASKVVEQENASKVSNELPIVEFRETIVKAG